MAPGEPDRFCGSRGAAQGSRLLRSRRGGAPQEPEQGSWLPGSLRGLAPREPEPGRLLPGVTIYHHPSALRGPCEMPVRLGSTPLAIGRYTLYCHYLAEVCTMPCPTKKRVIVMLVGGVKEK